MSYPCGWLSAAPHCVETPLRQDRLGDKYGGYDHFSSMSHGVWPEIPSEKRWGFTDSGVWPEIPSEKRWGFTDSGVWPEKPSEKRWGFTDSGVWPEIPSEKRWGFTDSGVWPEIPSEKRWGFTDSGVWPKIPSEKRWSLNIFKTSLNAQIWVWKTPHFLNVRFGVLAKLLGYRVWPLSHQLYYCSIKPGVFKRISSSSSTNREGV